MGTHWSFLETMKACLSAGDYPGLRGLSTREKDDFSMALMDAWAMVADILTFYQERIATEGYLRTATERWSILELARLVGYRLRPGVASSTYLAFTLEKGYELEIPKGTRAQSLPDPGKLPQSFETMEKVWAREEWGRLLPRTTMPQVITPNPSAETIDHLYVQGLNHELKAGYPIVFDFGNTAIARSIASVELQPEKNRTRINLIPLKIDAEAKEEEPPKTQTLNDLVSKLIPKTKEPTAWQPQIEDAFGSGSDSYLQVFATQHLSGKDQKNLYAALKGDLLSAEPVLKSVRAFGLSAPVFGHNAPEEQIRDENGVPTGSSREWAIGGRRTISVHVFLEESRGAKKAKTKAETEHSSWPELRAQITAQITTRSKNSRGSIVVPFSNGQYDLGDETVSIDKSYTSAQVRFFHAYPDSGRLDNGIDVSINGLNWLTNLGSHKLSPYKNLPEGSYNFKYCPPNFESEVEVLAGKRYTLIACMENEKPLLLCMEDGNNSSTPILHLMHVAPSLGNLKIGEKQIEFKQKLDLELTPDENTVFSLTGDDNKNCVITLNPKAGEAYDCFLYMEGNELANVIYKRPVRTEGLIGSFIFESKSSNKKKTIEIDWSDPDPNNLSAIIKLNGFLQQLQGTGNWEKLIQGNSIKIKYASKFDIQIEEESDLPLQEGDKHGRSIVLIDAPGRNIASGTWVVIDRLHETDNAKKKRIFAKVDVTDSFTESCYGIQATVTPLELRSPCYQQILNFKGTYKISPEWLFDEDTSLGVIRNTAVYAENSELVLAEEPINDPVHSNEIELDGLYGSLEPGRLLIVSGERADLPGATDTELAVLRGTFQGKHTDALGKEIESDTLHTFLRLADPLGHEYKRDTVTIFANVARATHGETREQILGSGDGSKNFQEFHLRQSPLTYLAAPTPAGAESTLDIRVNGVLWHEKDSLLQEGPRDRSFITKTDNQDKTEAIFGDGVHGARLPSGVENIKAVYRTGIGKAGNVRANQIAILASKPLGLKEVINPLPATGGADRDTIDQARRNIPLTAMSLDHLVSVKDYEDFAKSFAAIGKASATHLSDGRRRLVHVTIAGKGNVPIDKSSDLYLNLVQALFKFGDPNLAIQVDMSEQRLLLMDAEISIGPDYLWSEVEPKIRTKLLERFGFERRELGQDIHLSEIISAMTEIDGVTYVDVNIFHDLPGTILPESLERLVKFILKPPPDGIYRPNQCIYAGPARIEEKYEAEGWEDPQFIANRYGTTLNDLTELNNPADITEKISQHQEIIVPRTIMPAQIAFFTPYVKEMLNLRPRVSRNE
jgi:hypothetical protein